MEELVSRIIQERSFRDIYFHIIIGRFGCSNMQNNPGGPILRLYSIMFNVHGRTLMPGAMVCLTRFCAINVDEMWGLD